jgi:16S rRNA processing protein RimM
MISGGKYEIAHARRGGRFVHVTLFGVDTREQAQALRGAYLQVREGDLDALPEGEYYRFQLIGLAVRSVDGRDLGRVTDVLSAHENDIYVVSSPSGEVLIPAVDDVVQNIDLSAGLVTIEIIPGLLP